MSQLRIGDQIKIGEDIIIEISQIGKECHSGCQIQKLTGECIMPSKGIFAKVLEGGLLSKNSQLKIHRLWVRKLSNKSF